jgi:hypothetical protein
MRLGLLLALVWLAPIGARAQATLTVLDGEARPLAERMERDRERVRLLLLPSPG